MTPTIRRWTATGAFAALLLFGGASTAVAQSESEAATETEAPVAAAARGERAPVGTCANHGHWVSAVARGLESCDEVVRGAGD